MPRNYTLTPEARRQRSDAARAKWAALSKDERTEALRPAYESDSAGWIKGVRRGKGKLRDNAVRDAGGKFVK